MGKSKFQISRSLDEKIRRIISCPTDNDSEFANVTSAYILGFNYGNITNCVGLTTNYQLHHAVFPVVGLAFFKESPSDDVVQRDLKSIKEYSSSPNGLGSFKSDRNEHLFLIYTVNNQSKEVDKRIFNFSKGTFVRRKRHRLSVLNDPYCPKNVYNGSEDNYNLGDNDSMSSADEDQVDHLIFFIHGVGGVCDVRFRSCVEVVADFKKMANALLSQHSNPSSGTSTPSTNKHLASSLKKGFFRKQSNESSESKGSEMMESTRSSPTIRVKPKKIECLPISWHSLTRRQTGFSEQLNLIALNSVPKLRHFLNKVVMDAMLYSSGPVYTQTIMNNVGNEINRLYTLFMERHPNFNGSISLAGHSLGSVIVFDLLAHQMPDIGPNTTYHSATSTSSGTSVSTASNSGFESDSCGNNNNNNNSESNLNNNGNICTNIPVNTRQECLNASHSHHNVVANDTRYCTDYKNLQELLKDMKLTQYAELFHKEHIDLDSLLLLTDLDMKELRLPLGARRKLGTYINFKRVCQVQVATEAYDSVQQQSEGNKTKCTSTRINPYCNMNTGQCLIKYPQLKFKPRCFFSFGSPTAMFLNVRGIQILSENYKLPTCDRMLNIYHPYDPLAYRFEPLIDPRFKNVEPVLIPHHRGGKRIHVQLRESFAKVGHDIRHRLLGSLRNTWSTFTRMGSAMESSGISNSSSVVGETELLASSSSQTKRQKLSKSVSSSTSIERDSFVSCSSTVDEGPSRTQARNPLKRQNQIRRSQSEIGASFSAGGPNSLSSIIESSMIQEPAESDLESTDVLGATALEDKLKMFKLEPTSTIEVQCPNDQDTNKREKMEEASKNGRAFERPPPLGRAFSEEPPVASADDGKTLDKTKVGRLNAGRRIDYVLQEKPIELFNEYIFAFTSHANYWQNEDSALIILNEIYQVDGIQLSDQLE